METEKASHEEEERLTEASASIRHLTGNQNTELQNGNHFPGGFPQEANGNITWNEFKGHTDVRQVKRHCDIYSSPAGLEKMFDHGTYLTNGEIKHAFDEPSVLGVHQSKKLRTDSQVNGTDNESVPLDKVESEDNEGELDCFPDLSNVAEFDCDVLQERRLDRDGYFFPDGSVFSRSCDDRTSVSNGATVASPPSECLNGDAIEKTLCQYYPDHLTTVPRSRTTQKNATNHLAAEDASKEATHSPSLTSGSPVLPQVADAGQQDESSLDMGAIYGSYKTVLAANPQQSQQPCPSQDVPVAVGAHHGAQDGSVPETGTLILQGQDDVGELLNSLQSPDVCLNLGEVLEDASTGFSSHTEHGGGQRTFGNKSVPQRLGNDSLDTGRPLLPPYLNAPTGKGSERFGAQRQNGDQRQDEQSSPQGLTGAHVLGRLASANPPEGVRNAGCIPGSQTRSFGSQGQDGSPDSGASPKVEAENESVRSCHEMDWTNPNFPPAPQTWKALGSHPLRAHQDMDGSGPRERVQKHDFPQRSNFRQQEECSQLAYNQSCGRLKFHANSEFLRESPKLQSGQMTYISSQFSPQYSSHSQRQTMQEHLNESTHDHSKQIITSNILLQKQTQSHHYSGGRQAGNEPEKQLSQDAVRMRMAQSPMQRPPDGHLLTRPRPEECIGEEKDLKPSHCTSQNQQEMTINSSIGNTEGMKSPSSQIEQHQRRMMLAYSNGAAINDRSKFDNMMQKHPQLECYAGPIAKKLCLQHPVQQLLSNKSEARQMPTSSTLMHSGPQATGGVSYQQELDCAALGARVKTEWQGSCSHLQSPPQAQPRGELQGHAALRMHLLQRQEKQEGRKNAEDFGDLLQAIKQETGATSDHILMRQGAELADGVKQEQPWMTCEQLRDRSVEASMEGQPPLGFLKAKPLATNPPNKVKVEMSGPVTILSTHMDFEAEPVGTAEEKKASVELSHTKKLAPNLSNFLESPIKLLDTPIKNLLDTPVKTQYDFPSCHCVEQLSERDEGPYYTHLGAGPNVAAIRELMEKRFGQTGKSIRIEKVVYTGKEGKSTQGCPIAKWVIRRASVDEKLLVLVRERAGHKCATATIVVVILIWEGIGTSLADRLYTELSDTLMKHGVLTNRRCAFNEERTCACQGLDSDRSGASFSFGCSWSMYYNGCKFARSKFPRKFKLQGDDPKEEEEVEQNLQNLATLLAPLYKTLAPDAYSNQVEHENRALNCRLGLKDGRPFSGVTACLDFCAHAHRDLHNMQGGSTVVCTLTREDNREIGKIPEDEQLHVLPLYKISQTDEFGSAEAQREKAKSGAIQVLNVFRRQVRVLAEPAKCCRLRKLEAKKANKPSNSDSANLKAEKALPAKVKQEASKQSTPAPGPQTGQNHIAAGGLGHQLHHFSAHHQQQLGHPGPYPGSLQHPQLSYPRFPTQADLFLSTPHPNMYPKPPASIASLQSPLHMTSSHLNGCNPSSPYPGSLNPSTLYPGYPCNGSVPIDGHFYASSPKHLSMYQHQRVQLYSQQYSGPPPFAVRYPPRYSNHGAQVGGYSQCNVTPGVHPLSPYSSFALNSRPEPPFMEAVSQPHPSHFGLDYGALSKHSQYGTSPNPYLGQGASRFAPGQDSFHMHGVPDMELHSVNGMIPALPPLGVESCVTTGFGFPNGSVEGTPKKLEQGGNAPGKKEEVWSDNEHNFLDPEIGGVAVAPSHGSVLIECAKRELHATTPIKNPDRKHPARISLVFYQHKNLNEAKHGLAAWEAKMAEKAREKEEDAEKNGGAPSGDGTPGKNRKGKREHAEMPQYVEPPCQRFVQTLRQGSTSCTTNTYINTAPYIFTKTTGHYSAFI